MSSIEHIPDPERDADPAPPETPPDVKAQLDHIAEVSRNASATWFGLLGLLAFVGITLLGHRDADFFARGAGTQLPLVNITVPVEAFFLVAPALVAAVYAYFHLYLMTLWDALADAPPRIDNQPLSDRVYPWLISYAALWYRDRRRHDGSSAPRALGRTVVATAFLFGWLFGIVVLAGLWWRSMPAHDEWLTLWSGACLCFAALVGLTGFASARKRMAGASRAETATNHGVRWHWATASVVFVGFISWETTEGGLLTWTQTGEPILDLLVPADLREAELTPRPPDWKPFELWLRDLRRERDMGDPAQDPLIPTADEMQRHRLMIAALDAPVLRGSDLRGADLTLAFLPGADLRGLDARGASLANAHLSGAQLGCIASPSTENRTAIGCVQMQGANLGGAQMQGAVFVGAQMQGADLLRAQLQGAALTGADLKGADLGSVKMQGADLSSAKLHGAVALRSEMHEANCWGTDFSGALLHAANVTCRALDPPQMQHAVGDNWTVLPAGVSVASCLETLSEEVESALEFYPTQGSSRRFTRARVLDGLLCDRDDEGRLIENPTRVWRRAS